VKQHKNNSNIGTAPVDASKWSDASLNMPVPPPKEYKDIGYDCWHCQQKAIFSAQDQKYAYEVKKRYFWQRRRLCENCFSDANKLKNRLASYQQKWLESKSELSSDKDFLNDWLNALVELESYVPYKHDTAKKNMLKKLLDKLS